MCEYVSGVVIKDGRILFGDLNNHSGIAEGWKLTPGTYHEFEWTAEAKSRLVVRLEPGETDKEWWLSAFHKWPKRADMLAEITEGRAGQIVYKFHNGGVIGITSQEATSLRLYKLPLIPKKAQGRWLTWAQFKAIMAEAA
jgi:hypothetical protein